jgi:hypothetical protein
VLTLQSQRVRELNPAVIEHIEPEHVDPVTNIPIVGVAPPPPLIELPRETPQLPVPPLDESDGEVAGWLNERFGSEIVARFSVPEALVRNVVVTIDNLTREQMALNQRPITPTPGAFVTSGPEDAIVLAPENFARYEPFVALVANIDATTLVSFYRGLEPLFQQSYEELGHPDASFSMRLNEVIEHLLQTPTPRGEIALVQPSVVYRYADERLEKLSAGQKLLIRMGVDNAAVVKGKLRELQAELR